MDIHETNRRVIEQFRAGGEVDGMHRDRLLLLGTLGRRSGQWRTTPMMFDSDGDDLLVIASNMGAARDPDWYRNLVEHPAVRVEVGDDRFRATATTLTGERRNRVWTELTRKYPFFAEHAAATEREIPVVALARGD